MDTTKVYMHGFEINIRVETGYQDVHVISDCLGGDCYGLEELSKKIDPEYVFDIGGHIGAFGLLSKKYWPKSKLIAVEPCKDSYDLYCRNLEDNGFEGTVINAAISYDKNKDVLIHASRTTGGNVFLSRAEAQQYIDENYRECSRIEEVSEVVTVEDLTENIEVVDLAKWDCEGAEKDIFENILPETATKFRAMVGEYHLWGEGKKILQASPLDELKFWRTVKTKFPHLLISWTPPVDGKDQYGKFQAWPKE